MKRLLLLHGPNLNLLGTRQPAVYGSGTLADLEAAVARWAAELDLEVTCFQSNHEGALIDRVHDAAGEMDALLVNFGALSHYSRALADAVTAVALPTVEVHLSNIATREPWRRHSVTAEACGYAIYGRGPEGYRDALRLLRLRARSPVETVPYGEHPEQVVDIRRPPGEGPFPAVVLVHGGFWRSQWTRDTIDALAADLADRGRLTANIEYRRLDTGGGWPETGEDVLAALGWVAARPDVIRGSVILVGHSAGGHLALWAASRTGVALAGVAALAPVADLVEAHRRRLGDGIVETLLGGDPETVPDRYAEASPATDPPTRTPRVILHGADDDVVPVDLSRRYRRMSDDTDLTLIDPPGVDHDDVKDPDHPAWAKTWTRLTGEGPESR